MIDAVPLNGPNGQIIWVNPAQIVSLRSPRDQHSQHFAPGIECVIEMSDGKFVYVANDCKDVIEKTGAKE